MKIFALLGGLPASFQITICVIFLVILVLFFVLLIKRSLFYEGKYGRLRLGRPDPSSVPYSPHRTCPHAKDIVILLDNSMRLVQKKYEIMSVETIKLQMAYAEQRIDEGVSIAQSGYLGILNDVQADTEEPMIVSNPSYLGYRIVLRAVKTEVLSKFRVAFRENHLAEMDEMEFSRYVERMFINITNRITEILNDLYFFNDVITRELLYNENQKIVPKIRELHADIFTYARNAAAEANIKVLHLDEEHTHLLARYI